MTSSDLLRHGRHVFWVGVVTTTAILNTPPPDHRMAPSLADSLMVQWIMLTPDQNLLLFIFLANVVAISLPLVVIGIHTSFGWWFFNYGPGSRAPKCAPEKPMNFGHLPGHALSRMGLVYKETMNSHPAAWGLARPLAVLDSPELISAIRSMKPEQQAEYADAVCRHNVGRHADWEEAQIRGFAVPYVQPPYTGIVTTIGNLAWMATRAGPGPARHVAAALLEKVIADEDLWDASKRTRMMEAEARINQMFALL